MNKKINFISGLPRSGSTLLAGILRQNPRIHAAMTSPVGALFNSLVETMSPGREYEVFMTPETRQDILESLFVAFYKNQTNREIIFDTNRLWCSRLAAICKLFPDAKIICCVRNVAWIMDSIERLTRRNAFDNSRLFSNNAERGTVYSRVEALARNDRLVGFAWSALREACFSELGASMLLVDYDVFAQNPEATLGEIYNFIGEEQFCHDFNNVEYDEPEFDKFLGVDGLHRVARKVSFKPRETILPPDLFERYNKLTFWHGQNEINARTVSFEE